MYGNDVQGRKDSKFVVNQLKVPPDTFDMFIREV